MVVLEAFLTLMIRYSPILRMNKVKLKSGPIYGSILYFSIQCESEATLSNHPKSGLC